jgi:hypothetical protein
MSSGWKTIDELMKGKKPGEVEFRHVFSKYTFRPYFVSASGRWCGTTETGESLHERGDEQVWIVVQPVVVRYLWTTTNGTITRLMYTAEELAKQRMAADFPIRLEWSRTEFPQEARNEEAAV